MARVSHCFYPIAVGLGSSRPHATGFEHPYLYLTLFETYLTSIIFVKLIFNCHPLLFSVVFIDKLHVKSCEVL